MTFIELPESGKLINIEQIFILEHEVKDGITNVIAHFINGDKLLVYGKNAEFLVNVIQDQIYG